MPDDEPERPSLEPPKLFGRKRTKRTPAPEPAPEPSASTDDDPTEETIAEPTAVLDAVPATAPETVDDEPTFVDAGVDDTETETSAVGTTKQARAVRETAPAESSAPVEPARERRPEGTPLLAGRPAALVTGLLVGGFLVAAVWLGFRGCEAVRGTSSCGTGPGMAALVGIFVLAVVAGRYLLAAFQVPDPSATSFLAVGLTGVIALLFLVDVLDTRPMAIVIPVITAATFLLSWWVTTTFVESDSD